jgi:hypothetical protein
MSCSQSEQTPTDSQVEAIISPPFVGELWTDPFGLSSKKGVPSYAVCVRENSNSFVKLDSSA